MHIKQNIAAYVTSFMTVTMETATDLTLYLREGTVATITLNRPQRLNALTAPLLVSFARHLAQAEADEDVRAIVLTGAGCAFCAGQDLNDRDPRKVAWPPDLEAIQKQSFHPVIMTMANCAKPIVVAVNGVASGAGASLALAGDVVIAADSARFAFSFAKVGLSVDAGLAWRLVKAIGAARARALLLTGATISGREAFDMGLIWRSTANAQLQDVALDVARSLSEGPTAALGLIKQAVAFAESLSLKDYLVQEARLQGVAGASEDYREGVLSFLEKRPAQFTGR
jgi:2-(1,2-epoxy-1,2-dihydrophenyl)acetyl-CoA isomerase